MMTTDDMLVLVADASRAELLRGRGPVPTFETIVFLDNPDAQASTSARGDDTPGQAQERAGPRPDAAATRAVSRTRVLAGFASALAAEIEGRAAAAPGLRVLLAAPPRLLRMIEARLTATTADAVVRMVPKDLTKVARPRLHARLAGMLTPRG